MKRILHIIPALLLLISCEKEVYIPIEYTEPRLVVNGLFNTDSLWSIELSASKYIYDPDAIPLINDAVVTITDLQGNRIALTSRGDGIYESDTEKPEIGETYLLNVSHDNYKDVSSINELPGEILVSDFKLNQMAYVDGQAYRRVDITFHDSPEDDYYLIRVTASMWNVFKDPVTYEPDSVLEVFPLAFQSQNPVAENAGSKVSPSSVSFTDDSFNGNMYTFDLLLTEYYFNDEKGESIDCIYISISKISKEFYWYETSYQAYLGSMGGLFAQPVQVYTNITNGLGIFAGYSTTIDTIQVH